MKTQDHHTSRPESNPVFVSEPIGEGADAHRIVRVGAWEFTAPGTEGAELLMPDEALAPRLGLALHKLRELTRRHEASGNVSPTRLLPTVGSNRGRGQPGVRYLYSEADALFLVTRSETPRAVALTREMIGVYMTARRGLLAPVVDGPAMAAMVREILAAERDTMQARIVADLRLVPAQNTTLSILDRSARSRVLAPMMAIARTFAGAGADRRRVMQERGRLDGRLRNLVDWHRRWCLFPEHRTGELLAALGAEQAMAGRLSAELARARQLSLVPAPKPPPRGDA